MTGTRSQSDMRWVYRYGILCSLGVISTTAGTFLSWFRSGDVYRSSYATAALLDRAALINHPTFDTVLTAWSVVPLLCAVCVALFLIRMFRTAAVVVIVLMAMVGTVSVLVLVGGSKDAGTFGITTTGPVTTLVGATIAALGAVGVLATEPRTRSRGAI